MAATLRNEEGEILEAWSMKIHTTNLLTAEALAFGFTIILIIDHGLNNVIFVGDSSSGAGYYKVRT